MKDSIFRLSLTGKDIDADAFAGLQPGDVVRFSKVDVRIEEITTEEMSGTPVDVEVDGVVEEKDEKKDEKDDEDEEDKSLGSVVTKALSGGKGKSL